MNSWWYPVKASADCTVGENLNVSNDVKKTRIRRGWRDFRHTSGRGEKPSQVRLPIITRATISPLGLSKFTVVSLIQGKNPVWCPKIWSSLTEEQNMLACAR